MNEIWRKEVKNLITTIACIMILLVFVLQFAYSQVTHNRVTSIDKAVNSFKEIAKQDGGITRENEKYLRESLLRLVNCDESKILINGTGAKTLRGGKIHYVISVPIENLIAVNKFWGMTEEETTATYVIDNYTTSEYIDRI